MISVKKLVLKLPLYVSFKKVGFPVIMPFNYTLSLTYRCNSKCKTCNIWRLKKELLLEIGPDEWRKIIKSLGDSPFWITLSGGEPLLKEGIEEIIKAINKYNRPRFITIPTNALLDPSEKIKNILEILNRKTMLIINFSLDGIGRLHDYIRGVRGNWNRFLKSFENTKKLKKDYENLTIGIHTVVSKWNVKAVPKIYEYVTKKLSPDSYIAEVAENRKELNNLNDKIAPEKEEIIQVMSFLERRMKQNKSFLPIIRFLRAEYYRYVKVFFTKGEAIPSYAGFASVHITPLGEVWNCAVYGNEIGKLKDFGYDFKKLWKSKKAKLVRRERSGKHKCILASEFYSNILFDSKIFADLFHHYEIYNSF